MITRTFDATALNAVANHPDVRPWLGGDASLDGHLDLTMFTQAPNIAIEADGGGWVLHAILPGVYELHTLFLPEARGKAYFRQAKEALRFVFTATDALEVLTKCPDDNPGARMAAQLVGFRERFRREHVWNVGTPDECGVSYQAFTVDDWLARDAAIAKVGDGLWEALTDAGVEIVADEAWSRLAGAAVMMIRSGHAPKAVGIYNRAVPFAGFPTIVALRDDLIDISGAVVQVRPEGFGVLLAR